MTIPSSIRLKEGEQPGAPYAAFQVGATLGPLAFTVDGGVAEAYRELHGGDGPWYREAGGEDGAYVPTLVLALYLLPVLYQRYPPLQGIVLTHQQFAFHLPVRAGDALVAEGAVLEKYERRGRRFVRWQAAFRTPAGDLVAEARNTFMLPLEEDG